jgi:hypothetical protein
MTRTSGTWVQPCNLDQFSSSLARSSSSIALSSYPSADLRTQSLKSSPPTLGRQFAGYAVSHIHWFRVFMLTYLCRLDFFLTFVSVVFNYSGPFFLKYSLSLPFSSHPHVQFRRILDLIDMKNPTPESRARTYIYAFLAFACTICKVRGPSLVLALLF